jgi:hypothetical protein
MRKHTRSLLVAYVLLILFTQTSCAPKPPQGVIDSIIDTVKQTLACRDECADIQIIESEEMELSAADIANGMITKWCARVTYIALNTMWDKWVDLEGIYLVEEFSTGFNLTHDIYGIECNL